MVYWINMYRTWIKVADDNLYKEHIISRSDRTDYVVSRTLVLRAFKANGQYAEGTTWEIPEHELDRALATHRKQDASFRQRIKKAAMYLSPADAEAIIRLATYGIVRLELVIPPVPVREKPYYLWCGLPYTSPLPHCLLCLQRHCIAGSAAFRQERATPGHATPRPVNSTRSF